MIRHREWRKSGLAYGEQVKIPSNLFIEGERSAKRLLSVNYIGETPSGIQLMCYFQPGINTMNPEKWHYMLTINWPSIYCGDVKVLRSNGEMVRAYRVTEKSGKR